MYMYTLLLFLSLAQSLTFTLTDMLYDVRCVDLVWIWTKCMCLEIGKTITILIAQFEYLLHTFIKRIKNVLFASYSLLLNRPFIHFDKSARIQYLLIEFKLGQIPKRLQPTCTVYSTIQLQIPSFHFSLKMTLTFYHRRFP